MIRTSMILAAMVVLAAAPARAAPLVQTYQIGVNVTAGGTPHRYRTTATAVSFPSSYEAQIVFVGGNRKAEGTYDGLPDLIAANRRGLVMNGGFYTNDPSSPAGLLLVNRRIMSPFNFKYSATLCVNGGKLKILRSTEARRNAKAIASLCSDALQAFPIVVQDGRNDMAPTEMKLRSYTRSVIGLRRDGSVVAVFFTKPVHLYAAAEFLRAPPTAARTVQVAGQAGKGVRASGGLGLVDAANLSGDTDVFAAVNGRPLVGDTYRQMPSAIVIK